MALSRVLVVANKWWEADPLCGVLIHDRARPADLRAFKYIHYPSSRASKPKPGEPHPADPPTEPRLIFECGAASVEVWCLEELMNTAESSSSSLEKARVLAGAIGYGPPPALVIAFGTAGSREGVEINGSVVVGRRTFVHDPRALAADRTGMWNPPQPDMLVESIFPAASLSKLDEQARYAAEARLLRSPVNPSTPLVMVGDGFVSVGVVNITNYQDYVWADREAIAAFNSLNAAGQVGSVETTHGVIRAASAAPFLFVSAISDTEGLFDYQVAPRVYAQNFVAAHNAAVALAWLLPPLVPLISTSPH